MARTDILAINAKTISINGVPIAGSAAPAGLVTTFDQLDADAVLALNGVVIQGAFLPGMTFTNYTNINVLSGVSFGDTVKYGQASTPASNNGTGPIVPFPDGGGTSTPTPSPAFTTQPSITSDGTPEVGETLTGNDGVITNGTVSTRQWLLAGTAISGATGASYVPTQAGDHSYRVTATGAGGNATATSAAVTVTPTPTPTPTPAVFTATQLPTANRTYQRDTFTGGGQGKGQGTIQQPINVSSAGAIYAQRRALDGVTILQDWWLVTASAPTGAQTLAVTGVDAPAIQADAATPVQANDGTFLLYLSGDKSTVFAGTTPILMGDCTAAWGQSLVTFMFGRADTVNIPNAISPFGRCFAMYTGYSPGVGSLAWEVPSNTGNYKSAMGAEYLRNMVSAAGVAHGLVGYAASGTAIATWQSGQINMTTLKQIMAAAGGSFRFEYGMIGHTDSQTAQTSAYMQGALTTAWAAARASNSFPNPLRTVGSIPGVASYSTAGDWTMVNTIRQATKDWAATNGHGYISALGLKTMDGTHQTNGAGGGDYLARELFRSFRPALGLSGTNAGPAVNSVTRSGAVITIALSAPPATGSTAPHKRFRVFNSGNLNAPRAIASSAVSGSTITLTLAADPGAGAVLDLYGYTDGYVAIETGTDFGADCFFDQNITADEVALGFTRGRVIDFGTSAIAVAAQTPGGTVNAIAPYNLTMTSPVYQAGQTGFGNELASGYGVTNAATMIVPQPPVFTVEGWVSIPTTPSGNLLLMNTPDINLWIGTNAAGQITVANVVQSATSYTGAGRIFVRMVQNATTRKFYIGTTPGVAPTLVNTLNLTNAAYRVEGGFSVHVRSNGLLGNTSTMPTDEVAFFAAEIGTVVPTAPYVGNETELLAVYHLDGSGADACTN